VLWLCRNRTTALCVLSKRLPSQSFTNGKDETKRCAPSTPKATRECALAMATEGHHEGVGPRRSPKARPPPATLRTEAVMTLHGDNIAHSALVVLQVRVRACVPAPQID
jgi:hypothetical protein